MAEGRVKWWDDNSGYGFIAQADGTDVFVHHMAVRCDGYVTLTEGQMVEYDLQQGPHGLMARDVREIGTALQYQQPTPRAAFRRGVKSFTGESLRRLEYDINEWAEMEEVGIVNVSMIHLGDGKFGALVAYSG